MLELSFFSRSKVRIGSILVGVSCVIGSVSFSSHLTYAVDGLHILVDDRELLSGSDVGEGDSSGVWLFMRKLWLPVLFFVTVLANWEHQFYFLPKLSCFFSAPSPAPLSVYVFVEQLCYQSMRQQPHFYYLKSFYANKVEVPDYKLLCLATFELRNQKLTLVGILGGW